MRRQTTCPECSELVSRVDARPIHICPHCGAMLGDDLAEADAADAIDEGPPVPASSSIMKRKEAPSHPLPYARIHAPQQPIDVSTTSVSGMTIVRTVWLVLLGLTLAAIVLVWLLGKVFLDDGLGGVIERAVLYGYLFLQLWVLLVFDLAGKLLYAPREALRWGQPTDSNAMPAGCLFPFAALALGFMLVLIYWHLL
jgi:hypothetical protein